jgi:hypothetical protein
MRVQKGRLQQKYHGKESRDDDIRRPQYCVYASSDDFLQDPETLPLAEMVAERNDYHLHEPLTGSKYSLEIELPLQLALKKATRLSNPIEIRSSYKEVLGMNES